MLRRAIRALLHDRFQSDTLDMLMMRPERRAIIPGNTACAHRKAP